MLGLPSATPPPPTTAHTTESAVWYVHMYVNPCNAMQRTGLLYFLKKKKERKEDI